MTMIEAGSSTHTKEKALMPYSKDEAIKASTEWFGGDVLPAETFVRKYAMKRSLTEYEELTPDDMHDRMAAALASVEEPDKQQQWLDIFREQIRGFKKLVPQGSPMAGLGHKYNRIILGNCYVVPIHEDSLTSMFQALHEMAQIQAFRGGVGIDISTLRPEGSTVANAAVTSTGAWSWCDLFSYVTRMVGRNGRTGALMLTMDVSHPDIEKFISMKADLNQVTGANVSVKLSDEFMRAVVDDSTFDLHFEFKTDEYQPISRTVKARDIWDKIIKYATTTAEPGLLMWDNIIRRSPADSYAAHGFKTICTNPCAELPLSAYDSCRLTSINLTGFVENSFTPYAQFNMDEFKTSVAVGIRILDNMVTIDSKFQPFQQQMDAAINGRRLGLGIHALADMLLRLGLKYDSDEAIEFVDKLMSTMKNAAYRASIELAKERGPFPIWDHKLEANNEYINELDEDVKRDMAIYGRRNIAMLTVAPTGTVSLMSKTSSGLEPVFSLKYKRRVKAHKNEDVTNLAKDALGDHWKTYDVYHPALDEYFTETGKDRNMEELPSYWITADKIDWEKRLKMQAAITRHLDHSSSSTINLPRGTSTDIVGKIYITAWQLGLKGVTVYVDGSRDGILINDAAASTTTGTKERPKELDAVVHTVGANGHTHTIFLGFNGSNLYEVFCLQQRVSGLVDGVKGKIIKSSPNVYNFVGGEVDEDGDYPILIKKINKNETDESSSITRLVSTSLRFGVPLEEITKQLMHAKGTITSMAKSINRVLSKYAKAQTGLECPECGDNALVFEEGCMKCMGCGHAKCG